MMHDSENARGTNLIVFGADLWYTNVLQFGADLRYTNVM